MEGAASTVVTVLPAAQHGHAVGDGLHLVELVRDEDDGLALGGHRAERLEEPLGLLRREHGGRLVEDQNPGVAIERLQDLDALLLADRELPDLRLRAHGEPVALTELLDAPLGRRRTQDGATSLATVIAEHDVLGHGERLDEPEVLMHHADPRVDGIARRVESHRLSVELDLALVRAIETGQDVRQRRLAGAVLAEERVHLAGRGLEGHAVVRDDAGEPLRDARHAHGGSRRGAGRTGASLVCRGCGDVPHSARRRTESASADSVRADP